MPGFNGKTVEILLVEDSKMDIRLTEEALRDGTIKNHLNVVMDGEKAIEFLRRRGDFVSAPRPDIILLDLNLPRKDGREVLAEIKADPDLRKIPVIVLTTSKAEEDILKSYNLHVNCYITKPVDMQEFLDVIHAVSNFWLNVVTLPASPHD